MRARPQMRSRVAMAGPVMPCSGRSRQDAAPTGRTKLALLKLVKLPSLHRRLWRRMHADAARASAAGAVCTSVLPTPAAARGRFRRSGAPIAAAAFDRKRCGPAAQAVRLQVRADVWERLPAAIRSLPRQGGTIGEVNLVLKKGANGETGAPAFGKTAPASAGNGRRWLLLRSRPLRPPCRAESYSTSDSGSPGRMKLS